MLRTAFSSWRWASRGCECRGGGLPKEWRHAMPSSSLVSMFGGLDRFLSKFWVTAREFPDLVKLYEKSAGNGDISFVVLEWVLARGVDVRDSELPQLLPPPALLSSGPSSIVETHTICA